MIHQMRKEACSLILFLSFSCVTIGMKYANMLGMSLCKKMANVHLSLSHLMSHLSYTFSHLASFEDSIRSHSFNILIQLMPSSTLVLLQLFPYSLTRAENHIWFIFHTSALIPSLPTQNKDWDLLVLTSTINFQIQESRVFNYHSIKMAQWDSFL